MILECLLLRYNQSYYYFYTYILTLIFNLYFYFCFYFHFFVVLKDFSLSIFAPSFLLPLLPSPSPLFLPPFPSPCSSPSLFLFSFLPLLLPSPSSSSPYPYPAPSFCFSIRVQGLRRRGYTASIVNAFCKDIGATRNANTVQYERLAAMYVTLHYTVKSLSLPWNSVPTY